MYVLREGEEGETDRGGGGGEGGGNKYLTLTCRHVVGANRAQIGINPAYKPPGPVSYMDER